MQENDVDIPLSFIFEFIIEIHIFLFKFAFETWYNFIGIAFWFIVELLILERIYQGIKYLLQKIFPKADIEEE